MRVLIVEDILLVAETIANIISEQGWHVVGPVGRLARAVALAEHEPLDGAILDVNLRGEMVYPAAGVLARRSIPFLFLTGYHDEVELPPTFKEVPRIGKPFETKALLAAAVSRFSDPSRERYR